MPKTISKKSISERKFGEVAMFIPFSSTIAVVVEKAEGGVVSTGPGRRVGRVEGAGGGVGSSQSLRE